MTKPLRPPPKDIVLYLVGLLSRREYSTLALRQKLRARGVDETQADTGLAKIQDLGLQSDIRYAEVRAHGMMASGKGATAIRHELRRQGVAEEHWPSFLVQAQPEDEHQRAADWVHRRHGAGPWDEKTRRRIWGALVRRGFGMNTIQRVLQRSSADE